MVCFGFFFFFFSPKIGGIRFLYDNIIENLTRYDHVPGFGCILAHSMGLGKTLQVVAFIDVFLRHTPSKYVMCIVPVNTLQNWIAEFNKWLPPPPAFPPGGALSSSSSGGLGGGTDGSGSLEGEVRTRSFEISVLSETCKTMESRLQVVKNWRSKGGVLLIGYEMYRLLSLSVPSLGGNKMAVKRRKQQKDPAAASDTIDLEETEREMGVLLGERDGSTVCVCGCVVCGRVCCGWVMWICCACVHVLCVFAWVCVRIAWCVLDAVVRVSKY